jgi:hypothetical protein
MTQWDKKFNLLTCFKEKKRVVKERKKRKKKRIVIEKAKKINK